MGYTTSTVHGIEVPDSAEANNIPEDIGKVVTALEAGSIVKRLTGAQIAALTSPQKPAGLVVYNTTTGKLQISNGTSFADIPTAPGSYGTWSPTLTQGVSTVSTSGVTARYTQIGKMVNAYYNATVSATGTFNAEITLTLPVTGLSAHAGIGQYVVTTGGDLLTGAAVMDTTGRVHFADSSTGTWGLFGSLDPGDQVIVSITYEAA